MKWYSYFVKQFGNKKKKQEQNFFKKHATNITQQLYSWHLFQETKNAIT